MRSRTILVCPCGTTPVQQRVVRGAWAAHKSYFTEGAYFPKSQRPYIGWVAVNKCRCLHQWEWSEAAETVGGEVQDPRVFGGTLNTHKSGLQYRLPHEITVNEWLRNVRKAGEGCGP